MADDFLYVVDDEDQVPLSLSSGNCGSPHCNVTAMTFAPPADGEE